MTGEILRQPTGETVRVLRTAADTDGAYVELEALLPAGSPGPPPHRHRFQEESFEVLEGVVSIRYGRDWREVAPGQTVVVPAGVDHAFANRGDKPARMLTRETPAGPLHEQLRLLADSGRIPPIAALARLNVEHDLSLELSALPVGLQRALWRALARLPRRS